jgi:nucleobase transporter 1/2
MYITITCRLINPVVVAPTVAAVGLAFFSYGFPQAGSCVEISIPQILLLLIFTLVSDFQPDLDHSVLGMPIYFIVLSLVLVQVVPNIGYIEEVKCAFSS